MNAKTSQKITEWKIDGVHSMFEFAVRHMKVSTVKGGFSGVSGEIHFDPDHVAAARVRAEIDMSTIESHNAGRDDALRGERFFDVEKFPTATFVSTSVQPKADGTFLVTGDLTMRGITNEVAFDTVFEGIQRTPNDSYRGAFTAKAKIRRTDFGMSQGTPLPGGGFSLSDIVELAMYTSVNPKEE